MLLQILHLRCKPGNFNLEKLNVLGCQKCFCFDHSNDCTSEKNYVIYDIKTQFDTEINHWRAINDSNQYTNLAIQRNYGIFIPGSDYINEWFVAPGNESIFNVNIIIISIIVKKIEQYNDQFRCF